MASLPTHPVPALAVALGLGGISGRLLLCGVVCSMLPDVDVAGRYVPRLAFLFDSHRGATHSLAFALVVALTAGACAPQLRAGRAKAFFFCLFCVLSHILLDAMTDGGPGVAAFAPISQERLFLPWRPLAVSPLSLRRFFSPRGLEVFESELLWTWAPLFVSGFGFRLLRGPKLKFPRL